MMKFNLKTGAPWHEFSMMVLNAKSIEIDGFDGDADVENVNGKLVIKTDKPKRSPLKAIKGGKK